MAFGEERVDLVDGRLDRVGIGRLVEETCDMRVSIGMQGRIGSLNASVAAALLMYEKRRQEAKNTQDKRI